MSELIGKTLREIQAMLARREVPAQDVTRACLDRIAQTEPTVDAMLNVQETAAMERAKALDAVGPGPEYPLWGVPITIKDVLATRDVRTTCGSRMLENFRPFYDAHLVAKLRQAGAVILGKTNMDEFAMGSSTENSAYKPTRNPWDRERVPGGSSGGSAASVTVGQCFGSVGTDTGGSIRQPASLCGCVGLKPTYGRVSRYGLVAFGSSLDQAGPLTRTVADSAVLLQTIAGHDPKDSTSADRPAPDFLAALEGREDLKGLRLGLPREFWGQGLAPEVERSLRAAMDKAESLGAELVEVSLPHTDYAVAAYYIVVMAEASSNLARYDGVRYGFRDKDAEELVDMYLASRTTGFGDEVQRRVMIGTYVLSAGYYDAYYRKAAQVRRLIRQDFLDAFEHCDLICGGVSPVTAWKIGALVEDPLQMYLLDIFTNSLNLAGLPGISIPVGLGDESAMPVGLQIIGPAFAEADILAAANVIEQNIEPPGPPRAV